MSVVWQRNEWHYKLKKNLIKRLLIFPILCGVVAGTFSCERDVSLLTMSLIIFSSMILVVTILLVVFIPAINSSPIRIRVSEKGVYVQFKKRFTHISWDDAKGIAPYDKWEIILRNKKRVELPFTDSKIKKQIYFAFKKYKDSKVLEE